MRRTLTFVVALCLAFSAQAAPPVGPYVYEIGGDSEIWYPSGDATFCEPDAPPGVTSCLDTTTTTDGTGAVTGTGMLHLHSPGEFDGDIPFVITGQLAGSTRVPKPKLLVQFDGNTTFHIDGNDIDVPITGVGKFTCKNPLPHVPRSNAPATPSFARSCSAVGSAWEEGACASTWAPRAGRGPLPPS